MADCTAKVIHEVDSYSGISEAPSNVVAAFFAAAAPVLDLYTVAGVKLMHSIQFLAKAAFRDEHFHYIVDKLALWLQESRDVCGAWLVVTSA